MIYLISASQESANTYRGSSTMWQVNSTTNKNNSHISKTWKLLSEYTVRKPNGFKNPNTNLTILTDINFGTLRIIEALRLKLRKLDSHKERLYQVYQRRFDRVM